MRRRRPVGRPEWPLWVLVPSTAGEDQELADRRELWCIEAGYDRLERLQAARRLRRAQLYGG